MEANAQRTSGPKWMLWLGWPLSILSSLLFLTSAIFKFVKPGYKPEGTPDLGWDAGLVFGLGLVELICTVIYLFPRTAVLGAILLTGYLGGAVATHVRVHDNFVMPIVVGIAIWLGVYLRDRRLRALVPWRD